MSAGERERERGAGQHDRFSVLLGDERGSARPDERLLVVVSCPELGGEPLRLRADPPVSQRAVLAAVVEHFRVPDRPVGLRLAPADGAPRADGGALPDVPDVVFRAPGGEPVRLALALGAEDDGADWWHRRGYTDFGELVVCLERWAVDAWMLRVRLIGPAYGAGAWTLRAEGHGEPEEVPLTTDELTWLEWAWPLWLQANALMSAPGADERSSTG